MKKIVVLLSVLFCSVFSFAQSGIDVGDKILSLSLGLGSATNKIEGYEWSEDGAITYGGQLMTIVAPNIGLGFEFNGNHFGEGSNSEIVSYTSVATDINANIWNLMLAGRLYMSQMENSTRVYIPLGVGIGFSNIKIKYSAPGYYPVSEKDSSSGFSWYAGLGYEEEISENTLFGVEARFNGTNVKVDSLDDSYNPSYFMVVARLGYKF